MTPARLIALALALQLAGCSCSGGGPILLGVGLQTDMVPHAEFTTVLLQLDEQTLPLAVQAQADYAQGVRLAELNTTAGRHRISVTLLDRNGQPVGERAIALSLTTTSLLTVVVYADCREVECPEGDSCVAGECLSEELCDGPCDPSDPEQCEGQICEDRCPTTVVCGGGNDDGCSERFCFGGTCLSTEIEGSCESGEFCAVGAGCQPDPGPVGDGGMLDGSLRDGEVPDGEVPDGEVPDGALDSGLFDGAISEECGTPCTALCGTTGAVECSRGVPTGTCTPPPERCTGRDDDCDGESDEGINCAHGHDVVCSIDGLNPMGMPESRLTASVTAHPSGDGRICGAGFCSSVLPNCRTLPGPNGHTHRAFINGSDSIEFFPAGTDLRPGGTSSDDGHSHGISCSASGGGGGSGAVHQHVLDPLFIDEPLIYNRFCVPPVHEESICGAMWGNCRAGSP